MTPQTQEDVAREVMSDLQENARAAGRNEERRLIRELLRAGDLAAVAIEVSTEEAVPRPWFK